jgi:hypothetical protein
MDAAGRRATPCANPGATLSGSSPLVKYQGIVEGRRFRRSQAGCHTRRHLVRREGRDRCRRGRGPPVDRVLRPRPGGHGRRGVPAREIHGTGALLVGASGALIDIKPGRPRRRARRRHRLHRRVGPEHQLQRQDRRTPSTGSSGRNVRPREQVAGIRWCVAGRVAGTRHTLPRLPRPRRPGRPANSSSVWRKRHAQGAVPAAVVPDCCRGETYSQADPSPSRSR